MGGQSNVFFFTGPDFKCSAQVLCILLGEKFEQLQAEAVQRSCSLRHGFGFDLEPQEMSAGSLSLRSANIGTLHNHQTISMENWTLQKISWPKTQWQSRIIWTTRADLTLSSNESSSKLQLPSSFPTTVKDRTEGLSSSWLQSGRKVQWSDVLALRLVGVRSLPFCVAVIEVHQISMTIKNWSLKSQVMDSSSWSVFTVFTRIIAQKFLSYSVLSGSSHEKLFLSWSSERSSACARGPCTQFERHA